MPKPGVQMRSAEWLAALSTLGSVTKPVVTTPCSQKQLLS